MIVARSIQRGEPPWNHTAHRNTATAFSSYAWRQDIYGAQASDGDHRTWEYRESPQARQRQREHAAYVASLHALREAAAERAKAKRAKEKARKARESAPAGGDRSGA